MHQIRRVLIVLIWTCLPFAASAQTFPSELWHEGKVVLLEDIVVRGEIKYDLENNLVQVNVGNTIQTYSARKILFFEIFDQIAKIYRTFYALPYSAQTNYEAPVLFEVIYEGNLTLLCREYIMQENLPQMGYYTRNNVFTRQRLAFNYYFLKKNSKIKQYTMKKKDLFEVMQVHQSNIKQYIKKNKLRYDRREDLAQITAFYNELSGSRNLPD